jgi:hypothetical protein
MSKKNRFKKKKKNFGRPRIVNVNIVVLRDSDDLEKREEVQKTEHDLELDKSMVFIEDEHDLEWAKRMVLSEDEHTLQHYEDYKEALQILVDAKSPHLFMQF